MRAILFCLVTWMFNVFMAFAEDFPFDVGLGSSVYLGAPVADVMRNRNELKPFNLNVPLTNGMHVLLGTLPDTNRFSSVALMFVDGKLRGSSASLRPVGMSDPLPSEVLNELRAILGPESLVDRKTRIAGRVVQANSRRWAAGPIVVTLVDDSLTNIITSETLRSVRVFMSDTNFVRESFFFVEDEL